MELLRLPALRTAAAPSAAAPPFEAPAPAPAPEVEPPLVIVPTPPADNLPAEVLLSHTADTFSQAVRARLGCRSEVLARSVFRGFCRHGTVTVSRADLKSCSIEHASQVLGLCDGSLPLTFADPDAAPPRKGGTEKYVLRAVRAPHHEVEMVVMPAPGKEDEAAEASPSSSSDEWSLCVSSQVGCQQGCTFCETGRMGLLRNLSAAEIVAQVALARFALGLRVLNVVFMGMGEPLDNVDAVIAAVRALSHPAGLAVPLKNITVSTVGLAEAVPTLLAALPRVRMAFSVHCADDATRSRLVCRLASEPGPSDEQTSLPQPNLRLTCLVRAMPCTAQMPINRRVPLDELAGAMRHYLERTKRRVTVQYVLLQGVNDGAEHAAALGAFLRRVGPTDRFHVNLIPYNEQSRPVYAAPTAEEAAAFKAAVMAEGLFCKIRTTRGAEKMAACGQLGNVRLRRQLRLASQAQEGQGEPDADSAPAKSTRPVDLSW